MKFTEFFRIDTFTKNQISGSGNILKSWAVLQILHIKAVLQTAEDLIPTRGMAIFSVDLPIFIQLKLSSYHKVPHTFLLLFQGILQIRVKNAFVFFLETIISIYLLHEKHLHFIIFHFGVLIFLICSWFLLRLKLNHILRLLILANAVIFNFNSQKERIFPQKVRDLQSPLFSNV